MNTEARPLREDFPWGRASRDLIDSVVWLFAVIFAAFLRFEFVIPLESTRPILALALIIGLLNSVIAILTVRKRIFLRRGSFDEWIDLGLRTTLVAAPVTAITVLLGNQINVPRSTMLIGVPVFLLLASALRIGERLVSRRRLATKSNAVRVLVYGAGRTGESVASHLLEDRHNNFLPVGFLDDSTSKSSTKIGSLRVFGSGEELEKVARKTQARALVLAIPKATSEMIDSLQSRTKALGIELYIVPSMSSFLAESLVYNQLHRVGIEDLIGRRAVSIDSGSTEHLIKDKVVLITGAGGSIGVELARQVSLLKPARLVFLDRDETGLQAAQLAVHGTGLMDSEDVFLADIRERQSLREILRTLRPDVVFHAAALKHLSILERFPEEAWKTNVLGTANVLDASFRAGVSTFINISTDKAADPISVLGKSKQIAEQLTSWYSTRNRGNYISVRFGNVLGSRGSLIPVLNSLIEKGGPLQLTSPSATRYFMTIPEACQLVLQAATETNRCSVLVLDMGSPVRILTIAEKMIEISGKQVDIEFTGLRQGEKLNEILHSTDETLLPTTHSLVWRTTAEPVPLENLAQIRDSYWRKLKA